MRSKQVPTTGSVPHPAVLCTGLEGMVSKIIDGEWIFSADKFYSKGKKAGVTF